MKVAVGVCVTATAITRVSPGNADANHTLFLNTIRTH
jgi:hypothetical protein